MNNQPYMVRLALINLNRDELHYYSYIISLEMCDGSCDTAEDPFCRMCVSNKTEGVYLKVFNIIKEINESKTLIKHDSYEYRCEFDGRKFNSKQKWNYKKCKCECEKPKKIQRIGLSLLFR